MALQVDGVLPTEIKVVKNGTTTDLTVLKTIKNGVETAVWGKPFTITLSIGTNSSISVNRTSSPNQHARIGGLGSGSKVYYGDVLSITATSGSGYKIISFTINGTEYGNGQTSAVTQTITVTSAVTVKCTTTTAKSWQTVWTGSQSAGAFNWKKSASGTKTATLANDTPTGVDWSLPTRITGTANASIGLAISKSEEITSLELIDGTSYELISASNTSNGTIKGSVYMTIKRTASTPNAVITGSCTRNSGTDVYLTNLTLTKVEQYY